jgi:hypothetical protein
LNDVVFSAMSSACRWLETQIEVAADADTISLRDDDGHIALYALSFQTGQAVLTVREDQNAGGDGDIRNLTLEYIALGGIRWQPLYNLRLDSQDVETVGFDFVAAIQNDAFVLEDTRVNLAAGSVNVQGLPSPM